MIRLVSLEHIDFAWPKVREWVERACVKARSNRTATQLYAQCRNGSLWLAVAITGPEVGDITGVAILDISEVQGERTVQFVVVAGEGDADQWFFELIHWDWLVSMGIKRAVSEGRASWPRRLKHLVPDLRVVRTVFEWSIPVQPAPAFASMDGADSCSVDTKSSGDFDVAQDALQ